MSHDDTIENLSKRDLRGVIHCFTGTWQEAQKYIGYGFLTWASMELFLSLILNKTIKNAPLDRLLTETDCPNLTPPQEGKGARNEPAFVSMLLIKSLICADYLPN
jgi:TatD DNase family protein